MFQSLNYCGAGSGSFLSHSLAFLRHVLKSVCPCVGKKVVMLGVDDHFDSDNSCAKRDGTDSRTSNGHCYSISREREWLSSGWSF